MALIVLVRFGREVRVARLAELFAAFGLVIRGGFILGKNGLVWALGDAGTAVNAGVGVDIHPRPLVLRLARNDAFDGANFNAAAVAQAQTGDDMGHVILR